MKIKKFTTKVIQTQDLSPTAREVTFALPADVREFSFIPGQFMNIFVDVDGKKERRAYSISSSVTDTDHISFCIRKDEGGRVSPIFWNENIIGKEFELMGPIGLNTVDKLEHDMVYLLAIGVGISPVKSIIDFLLTNTDKKVKLFYGNQNEEQILYKSLWDEWSQKHKNFSVEYVLSEPNDAEFKNIGFVQDFIDTEDFENASVYICCIPAMAKSCKKVIGQTGAKNVQIMEESFS